MAADYKTKTSLLRGMGEAFSDFGMIELDLAVGHTDEDLSAALVPVM